MSTTAADRAGVGVRFNMALSDAWLMTQRNLRRYVRLPQLLAFSTIQPVMFVLLFTFVFGGAIHVPGVKYVDFLMPGILMQTVAFGAVQTGVGLADDLSRGAIERFRSLPIARSAVLAGRTLSDTVRNVFVVVLLTMVGALIGFRFHAGIVAALAALGIAVLFGLALSCVMGLVGMAVGDPETAQTAGFVFLFPMIFASSAFVPIATMPRGLRAFAAVNPMTNGVNALRALTLGGPTTTHVWHALAWITVLIAVFAPLSVRRYRRSV